MRLEPKMRKQQIMNAAVAIATHNNTLNITRHDIAMEAQVSEALVSKYFNTMHQLRRALVRFAVQTGEVPILALAAMSSDYKVDIPTHLKEHVAEHLRKQLGE